MTKEALWQRIVSANELDVKRSVTMSRDNIRKFFDLVWDQSGKNARRVAKSENDFNNLMNSLFGAKTK